MAKFENGKVGVFLEVGVDKDETIRLQVSKDDNTRPGATSVHLTPGEARELAAWLVARADEAEMRA